MKVVFVDNLVMPEHGSLDLLDVHPHLGLIGLAAIVENAGHTISIYDPKRCIVKGQLAYDASLYESAARQLLESSPDAVGFTTLGCSFLFAVRVAAILKQYEPELPILLGGPHATMLDRQILEKFEQFDVVVRHEADDTIADILAKLESRSFERIPGVSWRISPASRELRFTEGQPKVEDLDRLPIPSYDHYPVAELGLELLRIEAGRGCPFKCTFCSTASFFQRSFRIKSAGRLVTELDILHGKYAFRDFKLDHDMFTVNKQKVREFCEAVKDRGYRWRASARVDCVDHELLGKMAESGCVSLYFGIETGSIRLQESCKKHLDLNLVRPILNRCEELGIETTASFITGYPDETAEDQRDTLDMLGGCFRPTCLPQLHLLVPEPGTSMYSNFAPTIQYDGYGGRYNTQLVDEGDGDLVVKSPEIFQTYYYYPATMPREAYVFAVEAVDLLRGIGPLVVTYALRAFAGRLSGLIGEFQSYAKQRKLSSRPAADDLASFVGWKFGQQHHLTSLVRVALAMRSGEQPSRQKKSATSVFDPDVPYCVDRRLRLLEDIHDCEPLLKSIAADQSASLLDNRNLGPLVNLLVDTKSWQTSFRIDSAVNAILSLFEPPRSCREVLEIVWDATGCSNLTMQFFEDLAVKRIIVPHDLGGYSTEPRLEFLGSAVTSC